MQVGSGVVQVGVGMQVVCKGGWGGVVLLVRVSLVIRAVVIYLDFYLVSFKRFHEADVPRVTSVF